MNGAQKKRWALLLGVLAISMAFAFWAPNENGEVEPTAPVKKAGKEGSRGKRTNIGAPALQLDPLKRTISTENATDIFPGKTWHVPPAPAKPAPPPPPAPPPIPFVYLGKMIEDGRALVFLNKQDRNLVVGEGDVIEGTYRVESILPPVMTLTYLPLNMKQTFPIGVFN